MFPPEFRFFRPVTWINQFEGEEYYQVGGTATVVLLCGKLFLYSARHVLQKHPGRVLNDAFIPCRLNSRYRLHLGDGVDFSCADPEEDDTALTDVQIHPVESWPEEEPPLEPGEYIDITSYSEGLASPHLFLAGFPKQLNRIAYEGDAQIAEGDGLVIDGLFAGEDETNAGLAIFRSEGLVGLDANGMSGGAVVNNILGNVSLQGVALLGGGAPENDFIRFVTADVLRAMMTKASPKFFPAKDEQAGL